MNYEQYSPDYSEDGFWNKIKKYGRKAGILVLERAFTLYYCLADKDTPLWAKAVITGALGYFIVPTDAIPDILFPGGYADDAIVLAGAIFVVHAHIKEEHRKQGREQAERLFS